MATAVSALDEVLTLAKDLKVLRQDQLARILELAPKMDEAGLTRLKEKLEKIKTVHMTDLKKKTEILRHAASAHQEWEADKARSVREKAEVSELASSEQTASHLLSSL